MNAALSRLVVPLALLALAAPLRAQTPSPARPEANFAPPVRLSAGAKLLGAHRLFPSPVFHDMNGDGLPDLVVGDLVGKLTVALRLPGADPRAFAAETELKAADGKPIDFHNW
jgi:Na+-translocating ferredoxin:NAD+ oxidoreductase RnfD subunit